MGLGRDLAVIGSVEERDALHDVCSSCWVGFVQDPTGTEPAGGWAWVRSGGLLMSIWGGGEPNDSGGEDCPRYWGSSGRLVDYDCASAQEFLCE